MRIIPLFFVLACLCPINGFAKPDDEGKITLISKDSIAAANPIILPLYFSSNVPRGMLMYIGKPEKEEKWVEVPPSREQDVLRSSRKYRRTYDNKLEVFTTVTKIVKDYTKMILLVGYEGNPLATGEMIKITAKRIGVYEQSSGGSVLPVYRVKK